MGSNSQRITVSSEPERFPFDRCGIIDHSFNPHAVRADWGLISRMADRLAREATTDADEFLLISFVIYELIENAVKFIHPTAESVTLQTCLQGCQWCLFIENQVTRAQWERMREISLELQCGDIDSLFRQRITAESAPGCARSLGILIISKSPQVTLRIMPHAADRHYWVALTATIDLSAPRL